MFDILGFKVQEERSQKEKEAGTKHSASRVVPPMDVGVDGAAIHVDDRIQDERAVVYDKDNLELKLEARFPFMDEFRLVVRTYAIKAKFELFVFKTDRERYDAYYRGEKIVLGIYMHEPNNPVEISSFYIFLSSIISLSILCICLCLTIF
jgi:hypothetical protein